MERISIFTYKCRVKTKVKGLRRKILGFVLAFICVFRPETRFYLRLGRGTGSETHSSGTGLVTFFGHNTRLGGTAPKRPPPMAPGLTRCITPKRVTSLRGPSPRHCAQVTHLQSKKYCSGGKLLATLGTFDRPEI